MMLGFSPIMGPVDGDRCLDAPSFGTSQNHYGWGWMPRCPGQQLMGSDWCSVWGCQGCLWTRWDNIVRCWGTWWWLELIWVSLGLAERWTGGDEYDAKFNSTRKWPGLVSIAKRVLRDITMMSLWRQKALWIEDVGRSPVKDPHPPVLMSWISHIGYWAACTCHPQMHMSILATSWPSNMSSTLK